MRTIRVIFAVTGPQLIAISSVWGILFGMGEGPPIQGVIGGLVPTVTAVAGTVLIMLAMRDRS